MIKPSKKEIKSLELLNKWDDRDEIYNLKLHGIRLSYDFEEFDYLDEWFNFEFSQKYEDHFYSFGSTDTGGVFALWIYPDLVDNPPVVFFGSEGETSFIASSIEDLLCQLYYGNRKEIIDLNWIDDVEYKHNVSEEKARRLLEKSMKRYKKFISKNIDCKDVDSSFQRGKHPDFIEWVKEVKNENKDEIFRPIKKDEFTLDLSGKELREVPKSILDNLEITTLDLSDNEITHLPEFMSQLINLKTIWIYENKIKEIPQFFENFKDLEDLDCSYNDISQLNLDFKEMKKLYTLKIYNNPNFKSIDNSIYTLPLLNIFDYEDTLLENTLTQLEFISKSVSPSILEDITDIDDEDIKKIEEVHQKRVKLYPSFDSCNDYAHFIQYKREDNIEQAIKLYEKAIELKDDNDYIAKVYTHLAKIYYYHLERDFDKADELYQKAILYDDDCDFCLEMYISFLIHHKNDYQKANKLYKKLIKIDRTNLSLKEEYADFLKYTMDKPKKALKIYNELVRTKPNKKRYLKEYAELLAFTLEKPQKALKIFKKLLKKKLSANNYDNYLEALQNSNGDKDLIDKLYKEAIDKHPKNKLLDDGYLHFLLTKEDIQTIEKRLEHVNASEYIFNKYLFYMISKQSFEKANIVADKALKKFPNSQHILRIKLEILLSLKDDKLEIVKYARKIIELTEDKHLINKMELIIASKTQSLDNLSKYDQEVSLKKNNLEGLIKEATIAISNKEFDKSMAYIEEAKKIDPYDVNVLSFEINLLKITKNSDIAIKSLEEKLKIAPDNKNILIRLITFLFQLEKDNEAKKYILIAHKYHPKDEQIIKFINLSEQLDIGVSSQEEFEVLLKEHPNDTLYLMSFANFLLENNEVEKSTIYYKKVLLEDKKNLQALLSISQAYFALNKNSVENFYINKAINLNPHKTLNYLLQVNQISFKKYVPIVLERFPRDRIMLEWIEMVKKVIG